MFTTLFVPCCLWFKTLWYKSPSLVGLGYWGVIISDGISRSSAWWRKLHEIFMKLIDMKFPSWSAWNSITGHYSWGSMLDLGRTWGVKITSFLWDLFRAWKRLQTPGNPWEKPISCQASVRNPPGSHDLRNRRLNGSQRSHTCMYAGECMK